MRDWPGLVRLVLWIGIRYLRDWPGQVWNTLYPMDKKEVPEELAKATEISHVFIDAKSKHEGLGW